MEVMCTVNIVCEECRYVHRLQRNTFAEGERITLVCNGCEARISSEFRKPLDTKPNPEYSFGERGSWGLF